MRETRVARRRGGVQRAHVDAIRAERTRIARAVADPRADALRIQERIEEAGRRRVAVGRDGAAVRAGEAWILHREAGLARSPWQVVAAEPRAAVAALLARRDARSRDAPRVGCSGTARIVGAVRRALARGGRGVRAWRAQPRGARSVARVPHGARLVEGAACCRPACCRRRSVAEAVDAAEPTARARARTAREVALPEVGRARHETHRGDEEGRAHHHMTLDAEVLRSDVRVDHVARATAVHREDDAEADRRGAAPRKSRRPCRCAVTRDCRSSRPWPTPFHEPRSRPCSGRGRRVRRRPSRARSRRLRRRATRGPRRGASRATHRLASRRRRAPRCRCRPTESTVAATPSSAMGSGWSSPPATFHALDARPRDERTSTSCLPSRSSSMPSVIGSTGAPSTTYTASEGNAAIV